MPDLREITESSFFLLVSKVFGAGLTNLLMHLVPNSRSASVETSTSNASKNTKTASVGPPSMLTTKDIDSLMVPALKNELSKRNLPISGKKTVLVKRLKDHIQASRKNAEKVTDQISDRANIDESTCTRPSVIDLRTTVICADCHLLRGDVLRIKSDLDLLKLKINSPAQNQPSMLSSHNSSGQVQVSALYKEIESLKESRQATVEEMRDLKSENAKLRDFIMSLNAENKKLVRERDSLFLHCKSFRGI